MILSLILALHAPAFANSVRVRALQCRAQLEVSRVRGHAAVPPALTGDRAFDALVAMYLPGLNVNDQVLLLEIAFEMRGGLDTNPEGRAAERLLGYATGEIVSYTLKIGRHRDGRKLLRDLQKRAIAIKDDLG